MMPITKKFAPPGLTHSAAHHLLAADESIRSHGYARVTDIARSLGLTRGSASVALRPLIDRGLLRQDENAFFHLTPGGARVIAALRTRRSVVRRFLVDVLGLPVRQAERESCRVENLIEAATTRRLKALVDFWKERGLGDAVARRTPDAGTCGSIPGTVCPCCGLECIDGECSQPKKAGPVRTRRRARAVA